MGTLPQGIQDLLKMRAEVERLQAAIKVAELDTAEIAPPPFENLRKATSEDLVVGAVIWYPEVATWNESAVYQMQSGISEKERQRQRENECWLSCFVIVDEVLNPESDFKAFYYGQRRYGLDGAYVLIEEE